MPVDVPPRPPVPGDPGGGDLTVEVAVVPGRGRGRRNAGIVAVAVVSALTLAVASAWLAPSGTGPARTSAPVSSGPAPGMVASPATARPARPTDEPGSSFSWLAPPQPVELTPAALETGVRDGSFDGSLVLLRGVLDPEKGGCTQPLDVRCVTVSVPGLALPVDMAPALVYWQAPPRTATLVMRPVGGRLVYLGTLGAPIDAPTTVAALLARRPVPPFPMTLSPVGGWLVVSPFRPCGSPAGSAPCAQLPPFLSDDQPKLGGILVSDRGTEVGLEPLADGLLNGSNVSGGTFLVRHGLRSGCGGTGRFADAPGPSTAAGASPCPELVLGWDVVARLDGLLIYVVRIPVPAP
jgi:hypothetical protein